MTKRTATDLKTQASLRFPDNTSRQITPIEQRLQANHDADSYPNHMDLTAVASDDGKLLGVDYAGRVIEVKNYFAGGGSPPITVSTNTTITASFGFYVFKSLVADTTLTMPASPFDGQRFEVKRRDQSGYKAIVDPNGASFDDDLTIELIHNEALVLTWDDTDSIWLVS